jgi:hypothetical protein
VLESEETESGETKGGEEDDDKVEDVDDIEGDGNC